MKPGDIQLASRIKQMLIDFSNSQRALPGIDDPNALNCLVAQIIDSIRRVKYVGVLKERRLSGIVADPNSQFYDPIKASVYFHQNDQLDEAYWQAFLAIHCGKNRKTGWNLAREIYRANGMREFWGWSQVSRDFPAFRNWLRENQVRIRAIGSFGNHRKYQSLDADSASGTGNAVGSYIEWVGEELRHARLIENAKEAVGEDPRVLFAHLYDSMNAVISFGRMAKFDFLTMVGKLGLAPIEPGSSYMQGATGPLTGGRLLLGRNVSEVELDSILVELSDHLGLYFGLQVLEDAICNWQKNPVAYRYFGG